MIRFLLLAALFLVIAQLFWRMVDGIVEGAGGRPRRGRRGDGPAPVKLVRDPVCGTWIPPNDTLSLSAGGETHYFCSDKCRAYYRKRTQA